MMDLKLGHALGLFAGSGVSTAALQAAVATLGNDDPAVGYSVAYPFGVGGPILFLYIAFTLLKPKIQAPTGTGLELLEIAVRNPELSGKSLGELVTTLPGGVQIVALRREGRNEPASPNFVIAENDVLLATASPRKRSRRRARSWAKPPTATSSRTAGTSTICACLLPARRWWAEHWAISTCRGEGVRPRPDPPRRYRHPAAPDLVLEFGDRVGVLAHRGDFTAMRKYFGDSIKGTAEFSYISIGIGMALGFLIGAIQLPLPGIGKLSVGLAGVLIMALILGKLRRTGGMNWTIPFSANLVIRNLGLTLFLAQVGMASGPKFAATVTETGLVMLGLGAIVLVALVLPILTLGLSFPHAVRRGGGHRCGRLWQSGDPRLLEQAHPTDRPDIGYAMIFPGMTIVKILFVDIVPAFF